MNEYVRQLVSAIEATRIESPWSYAWFGERSVVVPSPAAQLAKSDDDYEYLAFALQQDLYASFYCQGQATPRSSRSAAARLDGDSGFVRALSESNPKGSDRREMPVVGKSVDAWWVLATEGVRLLVSTEDFASPRIDEIVVGGMVSIRFPREFLGFSPGFYLIQSEGLEPRKGERSVLRLYFNLSPPGAVSFIRVMARALERAGLPYALKILNHPEQFDRCDTVVLYVDKSHYHTLDRIVGELFPQFVAFARRGIPALTKPVGAGVSIAEDPGEGTSFGYHRCRILSNALARAHRQGAVWPAGYLPVVRSCFAERGIDIEVPFLNPGSSDDYPAPIYRAEQGHRKEARIAAPEPELESVSASALHTAKAVGELLCHGAIWSGDRCAWLTPFVGSDPAHRSLSRGKCSTADRSLYGGCGGIALFLAELYCVTGNPDVRKTALGAIRQALHHDVAPNSETLGLYTGRLGRLMAAARVAMLLDDSRVGDRARSQLMTLLSGHGEWTGFDLMSGRAGALVALLALGRFWPSDAVWEFAARLADDIVSHARMTERGCSWSTLGEARQPDLTGYLHGTAGIAQALLELFALVGERRYRETAFGAFAYERSWFEQRRGNWADLRRHRHGAECANGPIPWASATGWCHGAPGISLSRLRAYRLTSDPKFKEEALLGLETTKRSVEEVVGMEHGSMSLCHGLAGNLEVLLVGDACLGTRFASTDLVARVVAAAASCARAIQQGRPSTELPGHPPGVMLGFSGIGYFCLRVRDPNIPGMLFIEPERLDSHSDSGLGTQR